MSRTTRFAFALAMTAAFSFTVAQKSPQFNNVSDFGNNVFGWNYICSGGKFPPGWTGRNADFTSGGTIRFIHDEPAYGYWPANVWNKDGWYAETFSIGLALKRNGSLVFDNAGIEDGTVPASYYDGPALGGNPNFAGLVRGYSMSNNWDFIYSGWFKLDAPTVVDTLVGYFDGDGIEEVNPTSQNARWRFNIFSEAAGMLPTLTGKFSGDVLTSDLAAHTVKVTKTAYSRRFSLTDTDPIYRVEWKLKTPVTIPAGEYNFSHDLFVSGGRTPIDLNGTYLSPSSLNGYFSDAFACTAPMGPDGQVIENSTSAPATEGNLTPFSDGTKPPALMELSLPGKTVWFDVDLGGIWSDPNEHFSLCAGSGSDWGGVRVFKDSGSMKIGVVQFTGLNNISSINVATLNNDETAVRVSMKFASPFAGYIQIQARGQALNGAAAGREFVIGNITVQSSIASTILGGPVGLRAGFRSNWHQQATAWAKVRNVETDAVSNSMYVYSDDPYIKTAEKASCRLVMDTLAQPVIGYQAFLQLLGAATYDAESTYTARNDGISNLEFPVTILPMGPSLKLAAGASVTPPIIATDYTLKLAQLYFTPNGEGTSALTIKANDDNPLLPTQFSDENALGVIPNRVNSNVVVADDTAPQLSLNSVVQGPVNVLTPNPVIQGPLDIVVTSKDLGTAPSGLAQRPTIVLDFSPTANNGTGTEDIVLDTYSLVGDTFGASYTVPATAPCGAARLLISSEDDSGNVAILQQNLLVNTATLNVTVNLMGVVNPTPVTRWIRFVVGGAGGGLTSPVTLDKLVTFTNGVGTAAFDGYTPALPCSGLSQISAKDPRHTLRDLEALTAVGNQYSATVNLKGGDANDSNTIDILDYGIFAVQWLSNPGPNTTIGQTALSADFSAALGVDSADYTFIQNGFLSLGEGLPGSFNRNAPLTRCTPRQMAAATGKNLKVVQTMDLNQDGWITVTEISGWLKGKRSQD